MSAFQFSFAVESYDLIDSLIPKGTLARVLNSTDLNLRPNDPQPLFTPTGDFTGDGLPDMAITGIYGLPSGADKYFLLVGTEYKDPVRYESLYFKEYDKPVFLHKPGDTGEKDPGTQAFSITFCSDCSNGFDFVWNKQKKKFDQIAWVRTVRHYEKVSTAAPTDLVSDEEIDKALQIAGDLDDVKVFVAGLKKSGKQLGTSVNPKSDPDSTELTVVIFEKKKDRKVVYDEITVDTAQGTVVNRKRKIKGGGKGKP